MPKYHSDWFSHNEANLSKLLAPYKGVDGLKGLEIGVFEGRSTNWFLDSIFTGNDIKWSAVDPFTGSLEEANMRGADKIDIKAQFINNTKHQANRVRIDVFHCTSLEFLHDYRNVGEWYDFIYIDGSHTADNVMIDAILSFNILKVGGVILFDDYDWVDGNRNHPISNPRLAVNTFSQMYAGALKLLMRSYQVAFQKVATAETLKTERDSTLANLL